MNNFHYLKGLFSAVKLNEVEWRWFPLYMSQEGIKDSN